jgi:hypothetical protein
VAVLSGVQHMGAWTARWNVVLATTAPLGRIRRYSDARAPLSVPSRDACSPAPVAQRIEQQPSNLSVPSSNLGGGAHFLIYRGYKRKESYAEIPTNHLVTIWGFGIR